MSSATLSLERLAKGVGDHWMRGALGTMLSGDRFAASSRRTPLYRLAFRLVGIVGRQGTFWLIRQLTAWASRLSRSACGGACISDTEARGGSVCLNSLAGSLGGLPLVDHAAARSGWLKYIWSGVRPPRLECGRTAL